METMTEYVYFCQQGDFILLDRCEFLKEQREDMVWRKMRYRILLRDALIL